MRAPSAKLLQKKPQPAALLPKQAEPFHLLSPCTPPQGEVFSVCVCVEWSLVSVYRGESLASWQVTCDVPCCGLPLWDPVAESHRPTNPFPQAGCKDHREPSADGASSASPLLFRKAKKRWSKRWRWDWPGLPSQMPGEGWDPDGALLRACWAGTGAASAPPSTLSAPRRWSSALFLSLLCLIHTLQECCGTTSSPPRTQQHI